MELLDSEQLPKPEVGQNGKTFSIIGVIGYVIATFSSIYSIWNSLTMYAALYNTKGAPDAVSLSNAFRITLYAVPVIILSGIIGLIFQRMAFNKNYHPKWMWLVLLVSSIFILISGLYPPNPLVLILSTVTLFHVFTKKCE